MFANNNKYNTVRTNNVAKLSNIEKLENHMDKGTLATHGEFESPTNQHPNVVTTCIFVCLSIGIVCVLVLYNRGVDSDSRKETILYSKMYIFSYT